MFLHYMFGRVKKPDKSAQYDRIVNWAIWFNDCNLSYLCYHKNIIYNLENVLYSRILRFRFDFQINIHKIQKVASWWSVFAVSNSSRVRRPSASGYRSPRGWLSRCGIKMLLHCWSRFHCQLYSNNMKIFVYESYTVYFMSLRRWILRISILW